MSRVDPLMYGTWTISRPDRKFFVGQHVIVHVYHRHAKVISRFETTTHGTRYVIEYESGALEIVPHWAMKHRDEPDQ